jgi:chemotaxis protein methyltransferase CheR
LIPHAHSRLAGGKPRYRRHEGDWRDWRFRATFQHIWSYVQGRPRRGPDTESNPTERVIQTKSKAGAKARPKAIGDGIKPINPQEFCQIKDWIYGIAGISLSDHKHALVMGRLATRLRHYQLSTYGEYFRLLSGGKFADETQIAVDLLTTNETHFFREPKHFDFLRKQILAAHPQGKPLRVWSAASSSGEEPYSIAMTLAAALGDRPWEVLASDLNSRVLDRARSGHYSMARAKTIPRELLLAYCLKGVESRDGTFLIDPRIRNRVQFMQINLNSALPQIGEFDVIFLRNIMIYFDIQTKRQVASRVLARLRAGGHLFIGHSESLHGVTDDVKPVVVSVYRKA